MIIDAAIELLIGSGASEVTATRISEATGVARTTIYRQWPDQASLLLATIETLVAPDSGSPSTGNMEADLRTTLVELRIRLVTRDVRPVFAALVDLVSRDEAFVASQQTFITALVKHTAEVLDSAQQRGALPEDLDCAIATSMLAGPLLYRFLVMRHDIEDGLIDEVMAQFLHSISAR